MAVHEQVKRTSGKQMVSPQFQGDDGSGQSAGGRKGMSSDEIAEKLRKTDSKPHLGDVQRELGE